jgi:hypothetical protein
MSGIIPRRACQGKNCFERPIIAPKVISQRCMAIDNEAKSPQFTKNDRALLHHLVLKRIFFGDLSK